MPVTAAGPGGGGALRAALRDVSNAAGAGAAPRPARGKAPLALPVLRAAAAPATPSAPSDFASRAAAAQAPRDRLRVALARPLERERLTDRSKRALERERRAARAAAAAVREEEAELEKLLAADGGASGGGGGVAGEQLNAGAQAGAVPPSNYTPDACLDRDGLLLRVKRLRDEAKVAHIRAKRLGHELRTATKAPAARYHYQRVVIAALEEIMPLPAPSSTTGVRLTKALRCVPRLQAALESMNAEVRAESNNDENARTKSSDMAANFLLNTAANFEEGLMEWGNCNTAYVLSQAHNLRQRTTNTFTYPLVLQALTRCAYLLKGGTATMGFMCGPGGCEMGDNDVKEVFKETNLILPSKKTVLRTITRREYNHGVRVDGLKDFVEASSMVDALAVNEFLVRELSPELKLMTLTNKFGEDEEETEGGSGVGRGRTRIFKRAPSYEELTEGLSPEALKVLKMPPKLLCFLAHDGTDMEGELGFTHWSKELHETMPSIVPAKSPGPSYTFFTGDFKLSIGLPDCIRTRGVK